jgi:hypothetical protein
MKAWRELPADDRAIVLEWLHVKTQWHHEMTIGAIGTERKSWKRRHGAYEAAIAALEEAAK